MNTLASDIRVGNILEIDNAKFRVISTEHVKPGKGGAFVQTILQNIERPQKKEIKFRVEDKVNMIQIYEKHGSFLYKEGDFCVFLDKQDLEEYRCIITENINLYEEGCDVSLLIDNNGNLITVKLPKYITATVEMTAGYIPGQSAAAQEKPATLHNGIIIKVPQYIKDGDIIKLDTETMSFGGKA